MPGMAVKTFGAVSGPYWQVAEYLSRSVLSTKGIDVHSSKRRDGTHRRGLAMKPNEGCQSQ